MRTPDELIRELKDIRDTVDASRAKGRRIRQLANEALDTREARQDRLLEVEETATGIYDAIAALHRVVRRRRYQPRGGRRARRVDDALHLALLEITELGTTMYSVRSRMEPYAPVRRLRRPLWPGLLNARFSWRTTCSTTRGAPLPLCRGEVRFQRLSASPRS